MEELIWINGEVMPLAQARIGVEDRGFQFADGVYEVVRLYNGKPFTLDAHLRRLERSAGKVSLALPMAREALARAIANFAAGAGVVDGMVYLQATRGEAPRNHMFPESPRPTLFFYVRPLPPLPAVDDTPGVRLITLPDERWKKCDIKSIALLPNLLAKNQALAAGADEAVFDDGGIITECSVSNIFFIRKGVLLTHPAGAKVLPGITRQLVLEIAREHGFEANERPVGVDEAHSAEEVFITSTTREAGWVGHWDGRRISVASGPLTAKIAHALRRRVKEETASAPAASAVAASVA